MPRLIDVIEYTDPTGHELVHRIPEYGPADIRLGAQLTVRESQAAVFFRDGKALDVFGPGRHTLTTANLPILDTLVKFVANGQTPFQAEVYFVNLNVFLDQKWGTPHPVNLRDAEFGVVPVRAFGTFTYAVRDPQLLVGTLVGTQGLVTTDSVAGFLKSAIITHFNQVLSKNFKSILDAYNDVDALSAAMKAMVKDDFGKYGLEVRDFFVQEITLPDNVQATMEQKSQMGILGINYQTQRTFDVMEAAAKNPGGAAGVGFGMGAGFGMGQMMPQMMQNAMQPAMTPQQPAPGPMAAGGMTPAPGANVAPPAPAAAPATTPIPAESYTCQQCQQPVPPGGKFCMNCGTPVQVKPTCPNCHQEVQPGAHFCMNCGTKMG